MWVTGDIQFWICQRSTSQYTLSVVFFVVCVDTNSDIDPVTF
jgi:hypothetical protein